MLKGCCTDIRTNHIREGRLEVNKTPYLEYSEVSGLYRTKDSKQYSPVNDSDGFKKIRQNCLL